MFPNQLAFDTAHPAWEAIPAEAGVFALFGEDPQAEPYISRTPNLRRRLRRLLDARPDQTRRLRLAGHAARIEYALTGSDFEALLRLYAASWSAFGDRARKRLHLRPPALLRMTIENAYPRVYVTNKVTKSGMEDLYGPFPSRIAAETFLEDMLDLFKLRRCYEELAPDPAFPGCVYSEMKKCLAPCFRGCSDERYAEEAAAVRVFLRTRGASLAEALRKERDTASEFMEFERAAELHSRMAKAEQVAGEAPGAVRPLAHLDGIIVQPAAETEHVALFRLAQGMLRGPAFYSVAGMRHPNEAAGSTSLYTQPVARMEAVPLDAAVVTVASRDELEQRLEAALAELAPAPDEPRSRRSTKSAGDVADHLCLFSRWYYRPQVKRVGEIVFAEEDGTLPAKAVLRAISRIYRGKPSEKKA
ncbi:MAG TPA: excinuclease ABC subunit C [Acidobacteriaceae bacterium]|jgi:excinuclease UvrABC nuclease subunit|nr:excinuclease ABC subunit C [Acidobacteriaceae bacterium]